MPEFLLILVMLIGGPRPGVLTIHTQIPAKCEAGQEESVFVPRYRVAIELACKDLGLGPTWVIHNTADHEKKTPIVIPSTSGG